MISYYGIPVRDIEEAIGRYLLSVPRFTAGDLYQQLEDIQRKVSLIF